MKKVFLGFLLLLGTLALLVSLMMVGGCNTPLDPTSGCAKNHTAQVAFKNNSNTNTTYDVIWDGLKKATIAPGQTSETFTEAAGTHIMLFRITNTYNVACSEAYPNLAQCQSYTFSCSK